MKHDITISSFIFTTLKVLIALFVLKVILLIVGLRGYVPGLDEVFNFFMKLIFSFSGTRPPWANSL